MKYKYGNRSERVLSEVQSDLQLLAREMLAMGIVDIAAICGRRGKAAQEKAFNVGHSNARWGQSKHNVEVPELSNALDLAPLINGKIPWKETDIGFEYWYIMGGMAMVIAKKLSLNIRWGYYFKLKDLPHFEIMEV